ncbi:homeobox-leucine zipper protein HAT22-like protein [Tanacetum coccineum]
MIIWYRTKLKQIEQECALLKKCCEALTEENRRLKKELREARCIIKDKGDVGYSNLIILNPLTNEYKRLSKSNSPKECNYTPYSWSLFRFYYSCCEDDYKLLFVNFLDDKVHIYALRTDSWRKVDLSGSIALIGERKLPHEELLLSQHQIYEVDLKKKKDYFKCKGEEKGNIYIEFDNVKVRVYDNVVDE